MGQSIGYKYYFVFVSPSMLKRMMWFTAAYGHVITNAFHRIAHKHAVSLDTNGNVYYRYMIVI